MQRVLDKRGLIWCSDLCVSHLKLSPEYNDAKWWLGKPRPLKVSGNSDIVSEQAILEKASGRVGGVWGWVYAIEAVFDMQVFAIFQGEEICPLACKPCFKVPGSHCNFKTRDRKNKSIHGFLDATKLQLYTVFGGCGFHGYIYVKLLG